MSYNNNWNWSWVVGLGICASIAYKNSKKNDFKFKPELNPIYKPTISPNYTPYKPTISPNYTPNYTPNHAPIKVPKTNLPKIPPTNYKLSLPENVKSLIEKQNTSMEREFLNKNNGFYKNYPGNTQNELKIPPLNKNNSIDLVEPINPNFSNNSNKHFK